MRGRFDQDDTAPPPSHTQINAVWAIKAETISRGLKYSLATGNWGMQGTQGIRAGVSQVCEREMGRVAYVWGGRWSVSHMCGEGDGVFCRHRDLKNA